MRRNIDIRIKGYAGSWVTIMVCTKPHGIRFSFPRAAKLARETENMVKHLPTPLLIVPDVAT